MANLSFAIRASLGLIPKTEKMEALANALNQEYKKLKDFEKSELLAEYLELETLVGTQEFIQNKKNISALNFKDSEEFKQEEAYVKLKKSKAIINYFKVLNSAEYETSKKTAESKEFQNYLALVEHINSIEHKEIKPTLDAQFKAESDKKNNFLKLKKSATVKGYFKVGQSSEYKIYTELNNSEELAEFLKLEEFAKSSELAELKKSKEYKQGEAFSQETRYLQLKNSNRIKTYFKFLKSGKLEKYNAWAESEVLAEFSKLEVYVNSAEYSKTLESLQYKNSEAFKNEKELEGLKQNQTIKNHLNFTTSKAYILFTQTEGSTQLTEYNQLDELVNSEKFKLFKAYMLDKDKYSKTEDAKKEKRFSELKNHADIKWYFAVKNSKKFDELKKWNLTFEDDFTGGKLDTDKWMNSYFWGKMLLNDRYVLAGDKQYYTDNKNIELNGTTLKIVTKREKATGKVWHPIHGFNNQDFNYTSGMLSTAHNFRQQYGRIEAKVKLSEQYPVYQAFWLKAEKIMPEIDVFKFNMDKPNRLQLSTIWGDANNIKSAQKATTKLNGKLFTTDFYIFTLDWTAEKLTWKINGIEVFSTTQGIPNEPMYLIFTNGLQAEAQEQGLPASFEIDWVRCYEAVKI